MSAPKASVVRTGPRGSPLAFATGPQANAIKLSWIVRLRWGAVVGQAVTLFVGVAVFRLELPLLALTGIVALQIAVNLGLHGTLRATSRVSEGAVAGALLFDVVAITALLALAGGPRNPFTTIYLVDVALAAVLLTGGFAWAMLGASAVLYLLLFALYDVPALRLLSPVDLGQLDRLHFQGTAAAVAVAGGFVVYIVQRVQQALTRAQEALAEERSLSARRDKVTSLATLAAGAAHELSTPLATIAVAAKELERSLAGRGAPGDDLQDLALIRSQVARCGDILHQMSAQAGENAGEPMVPIALQAWVEEVLAFLPDRERVQVDVPSVLRQVAVRGPPRGLARVLRGLLKNALQATAGGAPVLLRLRVVDGRARIEVEDHGCGMPDDILARAGEPFFTTKVPGAGTGLGLFLARALAEQLGGKLELRSAPGTGTQATLEIPVVPPGANPQ